MSSALLRAGALACLWAAGPALSQPLERIVELPGSAAMHFVWVPAGTFVMGSAAGEAGRHPDEGPLHPVSISRGFWLGRCEVTQAQWRAVMGTEPWSGHALVVEDGRHPAVNISPDEWRSFIARLNRLSREGSFRLPTEAEWEYACRAGTRTRWSFGEDEGLLGEYAWYAGNARDAGQFFGHAVGTRRANPWGLYDMHGNVWELVADWYGAYGDEAQVDPQGPPQGAERVARGGSFGQPAHNTRSAKRVFGSLDDLDGGMGARLVWEGAEGATGVGGKSWGRVKGGQRPVHGR